MLVPRLENRAASGTVARLASEKPRQLRDRGLEEGGAPQNRRWAALGRPRTAKVERESVSALRVSTAVLGRLRGANPKDYSAATLAGVAWRDPAGAWGAGFAVSKSPRNPGSA